MNRNRIASLFKVFSSQLDQYTNMMVDAIEGEGMGLSGWERGQRIQSVVQSTALISTATLMFRWASSYYDDDNEEKVGPAEYLAENIDKQFALDLTHGVFGGVPLANDISSILASQTYNALTDHQTSFYEYRDQIQGVMKSPVGQVVDDVLHAYQYKLDGNDEMADSTLYRAIEKLSGVPYSGTVSSLKQVGGMIKYLKDQLSPNDPRIQKLNDIDF